MHTTLHRRRFNALAGLWALGAGSLAQAADDLPLFDAHIHYSHDAWDLVPPRQAVAILRKAGLKGAILGNGKNIGAAKTSGGEDVL